MEKNETNPLISVVIPLYNVEDYLEQCLSSVLSQTYDPFEVICIDDGSTDATGSLLDAIADSDNRIKVHHSQNAGLSEARNKGADLAQGTYVTFVDADDFVSPYYLSALSEAMEGRTNRFVRGLPVVNSRDNLANIHWECPTSIKTLSISEAIDEVLGNKVPESSWACLLPRASYQEILFPKGMLHEDTSTILDFLALFDEFSIVEQPIYAYVIRQGSIMNTKSASFAQICDYCAAIGKMQSFVLERCPEKLDLLSWRTALCYTRCYSLLDSADPNDPRVLKLKSILHDFVRSVYPNLVAVTRRHSLSKLQLGRYALFAISPQAEKRVLKLYKSLR